MRHHHHHHHHHRRRRGEYPSLVLCDSHWIRPAGRDQFLGTQRQSIGPLHPLDFRPHVGLYLSFGRAPPFGTLGARCRSRHDGPRAYDTRHDWYRRDVLVTLGECGGPDVAFFAVARHSLRRLWPSAGGRVLGLGDGILCTLSQSPIDDHGWETVSRTCHWIRDLGGVRVARVGF